MSAGAGTLRVRDLHAGYGGPAVIDGISLPPMPPGRVVALVGPNAAGKSTLLRAMANIVAARGEIRLGEVDLMRLTPAERALRVGLMPQHADNDVSLTVLETVIAALRMTGAGDRARSIDERAFAVLQRLDVSHLASTRFNSLSGGQKQVASLAQAVACEPPVLLLDEPTSALDPAREHLIMRTVRDYAGAGRIVVAVVHDLTLAAQWADDVFVLAGGALHGARPPADIITPAMLAAVYGVRARVEPCSRGRLQVLVDGVVPGGPTAAAGWRKPQGVLQ